MRFTYLSVFVAGAVLVIALVCVFFVANRPQIITIDADIPENFPDSGFAHDAFENLLQRYVDDDGNVDFDRWHQNVADRPVIKHAFDDVGVIAVHPVGELIRFSGESFGSVTDVKAEHALQ